MGFSGKMSLKPIHCFRGAGSFKMIKGFDVLNYDEEAGIGAAAAQAWEGFHRLRNTWSSPGKKLWLCFFSLLTAGR